MAPTFDTDDANPLFDGPQPEPEPAAGRDGGASGPFETEESAARSQRKKDRGRLHEGCCGYELPSSLAADQIQQLVRVTNLNAREIRTIDNLFQLLLEISEAAGEQLAFRADPEGPAGEADGGDAGEPALTVKQLRRLPELSQNVFLGRFIRIFSETGDSSLTLHELIDMYSALSRRATFEWKAWTLFCIFDYDEDGMLDKGDIYRAVRQMMVATHSVRFSSRTEAAVVIQQHVRGRQSRRAFLKILKDTGHSGLKGLGRSPTPTEAYVDLILSKCGGVKMHVMDFRCWQTVLRRCPDFADKFSVTLSKPRKLARLVRGRKVKAAAKVESAKLGRIGQFLEDERAGWEHVAMKLDMTRDPFAVAIPGRIASITAKMEALSSVTPRRSERWGRQDALAKQLRQADRQADELARDSFLRADEDDYDSKGARRQRGPYGRRAYSSDMGQRSDKGIRPPTIKTRLRWIGLDMQMLRMLSGKEMGNVHQSDKVGFEVDNVDEVLKQFSTKRNTPAGLGVWSRLSQLFEGAHHRLWGRALSEINHKHGSGIAELAEIMKWMLLLNATLGIMWLLLVIIPRDFDPHNDGVHESMLKVLMSMVFDGSETPRNLYYDGFRRKQGYFEHMDLLYFACIILTIVVSLSAMLRKLGHRDMGGAKKRAKYGGADGGMEWASILGQFDFGVVDPDASSKMRQSIRGRIDDWHAANTEKLMSERLEDATPIQILIHKARLRAGKVAVWALLLTQALSWFYLLNNEQTLQNYHVLFGPTVLAALNVGCPVLIKLITKLEGRIKAVDVMEACVQRIFRVKVVQLVSIYWTLLAIMSRTLTDVTSGLGLGFFEDTSGSGAALADGGVEQCAEVRSGEIFMRQLIMDAVVFISIQYGCLFLVRVGFPNPTKWFSAVNHFNRDHSVEAEGYRLERRVVHHTTGSSDLLVGEDVRWYMVQPHLSGAQFKHSVITMVLKHFVALEVRIEGDKEAQAVERASRYRDHLEHWKGKVEDDMSRRKTKMMGTDSKSLTRTATSLGLFDADRRDALRKLNIDVDTLRAHKAHWEGTRESVESAVRQQSLVFSAMDLDAFSDEQLLDTAAKHEVDEDLIDSFQDAVIRGKENIVVGIIEEEGHEGKGKAPQLNKYDYFERRVSAFETTQHEFMEQLREGLHALGTYVENLHEKGVDELQELLDSKPKHHARNTRHKQGDAMRKKKQSQGDALAKKRAIIHALLKTDVHHPAPVGAAEILHELRDLLARLPVDQLELMLVASQERCDDEMLSKEVVLERAHAWCNHRWYRNQSISAWLLDISVPAIVKQEKGQTRPRREHKKLNEETRRKLAEGFERRGITNVGGMLDSQLSDEELRDLIPGKKLPKQISKKLREAQGRWIDVTQQVAEQRWIRLPPTELKHDESATLIIGMLWRQVFVWAGTPFCPWLPAVACVAQVCMFFALQHSLLHGRYAAPKHPWAAGKTTEMFMTFGMKTLLLCVLPTTMWLNVSPLCGPHEGFAVVETFSLFEQDHILPKLADYADTFAVLVDSSYTVQIYSTLSFMGHYIMNTTFLLLMVFVMWTRSRTRKIRLMHAIAQRDSLEAQGAADANYLSSRLRKSKYGDAHQDEFLLDEQQKLHQFMLHASHTDEQQKGHHSVGLTKTDVDENVSTVNEAWEKVVTRVWPIRSHHGIGTNHKHAPLIWLMQDLSVPRYTQFTIRLNDEVMLQPHLQPINLDEGASRTSVLTFDLPPRFTPDALDGEVWQAQVTVTAAQLNCAKKTMMAVSASVIPSYSYECKLLKGSQGELVLTELQESVAQDHPWTSVMGIARGPELNEGDQRWDVRVSQYRETPEHVDSQGIATSDRIIVEYQVDVLLCTVHKKKEKREDRHKRSRAEVLSGHFGSAITTHQLEHKAETMGVDPAELRLAKQTAEPREAILELIADHTPPKTLMMPVPQEILATSSHRFSHVVNLSHAIKSCVDPSHHARLPPPPVHLHHHMHMFSIGEHAAGKKYLDASKKHIEEYLMAVMNCPYTQAHRNPYVLGLFGIFHEDDPTNKSRGNRPEPTLIGLKKVDKSDEVLRMLMIAIEEQVVKNPKIPGSIFDLDEKEIRQVCECMEGVHYPAGDPIFRKGYPGDFFYVVETGECSVFLDDKAEKAVATEGPGSGFGELALLNDSPRAATVSDATLTCQPLCWSAALLSFERVVLSVTDQSFDGFDAVACRQEDVRDRERGLQS